MGEAWSDTYGVTAPALVGVWMHAPADPEVTERHFPFKKGDRAELLGVDAFELRFNGREFPIFEFGDGTSETVSGTIVIPHDELHDAGVQWWRDATLARRVICYRDNRGRVVFGSLGRGPSIADIAEGTSVTFTVTRIDFTEAI